MQEAFPPAPDQASLTGSVCKALTFSAFSGNEGGESPENAVVAPPSRVPRLHRSLRIRRRPRTAASNPPHSSAPSAAIAQSPTPSATAPRSYRAGAGAERQAVLRVCQLRAAVCGFALGIVDTDPYSGSSLNARF